MHSISLNDVALSRANGYRVLSATKPLTWEAPDFTLMARGGRTALSTGTRWPNTMPSLAFKLGVFADSDEQLRVRLGTLYRVLYSDQIHVADTARWRYITAVLGSSVALDPFPASHSAEITFTLDCLTHGWLANTETVLEGQTEQGGAFQVTAACGDVPIQGMDVLLAMDSNSKATLTTDDPVSQLSLDLSNAPEIPSGYTYWYRLNTTTYQGGKVALDEWDASWDASDDVSQYLSMSFPGFTLTPGISTGSTGIRVSGAAAVKIRYRMMWAV